MISLNNLSVANRIHILEPQWNPSVESQAIGRVLRLGQTKTVHVIRYIVRATVEIVRPPRAKPCSTENNELIFSRTFRTDSFGNCTSQRVDSEQVELSISKRKP